MELLTVGQMAKLAGVSAQTLRLYDREGLLRPAHRGGDNDYRYYDIRQCATLDMIQHMKSLGMSLSDIGALFANKDLASLEAILHEKLRQVDGEIKALKVKRRAVERSLESYERYRSAPPDGTVVLEYIGSRLMYLTDTGVNFYDYGMEVYEEILARLRARLARDHLPQIYFCNAGTVLHRVDFLSKRFHSTEFFVFVDREFVSSNLVREVPSGTYLCIYCDSFHKEKDYAGRLLAHARAAGYTVTGDYMCETVAQLPVIGGGERGMFLRLQIPVSFAK